MFGLVSKIIDPVTDTLTAASAVITTSARATVKVAESGAAEAGMRQLSGTINHSLLSLNETMKSVALSACLSNDKDFAEAKASNPQITNFNTLDEYLASRM